MILLLSYMNSVRNRTIKLVNCFPLNQLFYKPSNQSDLKSKQHCAINVNIKVGIPTTLHAERNMLIYRTYILTFRYILQRSDGAEYIQSRVQVYKMITVVHVHRKQ